MKYDTTAVARGYHLQRSQTGLSSPAGYEELASMSRMEVPRVEQGNAVRCSNKSCKYSEENSLNHLLTHSLASSS